jgi:hypothetical protein
LHADRLDKRRRKINGLRTARGQDHHHDNQKPKSEAEVSAQNPTPLSMADHSAIGAILETTKDVASEQSGCLANRDLE